MTGYVTTARESIHDMDLFATLMLLYDTRGAPYPQQNKKHDRSAYRQPIYASYSRKGLACSQSNPALAPETLSQTFHSYPRLAYVSDTS